ncbi:MAG: hypothetical protein AB8G17_16160 [Gammaproteobacteria bacterium]
MTTTNLRLLLSTSLCALLIGCGGGASDAPQEQPTTPTSSKITLSGIVTDNPIVNASIMVRVANNAFGDAPPTGSNGEFTVDITSENPAALVSAEALDAVNGVKLSAVLDTFSNYTSQARNGVVAGVKITNVTTALQVLAERLASDGSIDSYSEYTQLAEAVSGEELFELAAALKVVIENIDGSVLPAGINDTVELAHAIADGSSSFLSDLTIAAPEALSEARNKLLTDGNATLPFGPSDAPGVYSATNGRYIYAVFPNGVALVDNRDDNAVPGTPSWSLNELGQLVVRFFGFERETDALSVIGEAGDVVHMVRQSDFGNQQITDASGAVKRTFGAAYDSADVPGSWIDSAISNSRWVFDASGSGHRLNTLTQIQSDAFQWNVTTDGHINMAFDGTDESMQFSRLSGADEVLKVSRFAGQYAYLNVATLVKE